MDITAPMVGAWIFGLLMGAASIWAFGYSERRIKGRESPAPPLPQTTDDLASLLLALRSAVIILDKDFTILRASSAAYAFGLVRDDRIAHERVMGLIRQVARENEAVEEELSLQLGPVGTGEIALWMRVAPLWADDIVVLADDRTEAVRAEQIRHEFVTNISHELKTPVGAISLLSETIESAADDPEAVRRFAGRMEAEAHRLDSLVRDIIELSHLQTAVALRDLKPIAVRDIVAEAVEQSAMAADSKGLRVDVTAAANPNMRVFGDKTLLVNAIRNLLDNAVHYSPEGTLITVITREADGLAEISVSDQGIGIASEDQERIFERFYRVDKARSRDTGGTGLGLSIVKHIAANHGGDITVRSVVGRGSTFTFRIPLVRRSSIP